MKVTVLGSAAAEAQPALWCECKTCDNAIKNGGKDVRKRTAYRIDSDTLVDFGPDAFWQSQAYNIDLRAVDRIIFTHAHEDHFNPLELSWRRPGFSSVSKMLKIFGNDKVIGRLNALASDGTDEKMAAEFKLSTRLLTPGTTVTDGDIGIFPIKAQHAPDQTALNFVISRGGRRLLIANDTGWWSDESWDMIDGIRLDAAVIECTFGLKFRTQRNGHLGAEATIAFRDELARRGAVTSETKVFTNHYSHNGDPLQKDLEEYFIPKGIIPAYDGFEFTV